MANRTLKKALLSNAAFSTLTGLFFLLMGETAADMVGLGSAASYQILGIGLLGFAGYTAWVAIRKPLNTFKALQISAADLLWVVGTVVLIVLASGALQPAGIIAMLIVAGVVLFFALWQLKGISNVYAVSKMQDTHRICVAIQTTEAADKMWAIVADMENIKAYSPHLTDVILRGGVEPGVGTVRQCTDDKGKSWAERCTTYDHQSRRLDVIFLADEPNFPYPFKTMVGGWEVVPAENGSTVNLWFEVTPKYSLLQPVILGIMSKDVARNFADVVARMAAAARGEAVPQEQAPPRQGISYALVPCG